MVGLDRLTFCSDGFAKAARVAFETGKIDTCSKIISEHIQFLLDNYYGCDVQIIVKTKNSTNEKPKHIEP